MPKSAPLPSDPRERSERRKFVVLIVLGMIVIILLWVATLPLTLRVDDAAPLGSITGRVGAELDSIRSLGNYFSTVKDAQSGQ